MFGLPGQSRATLEANLTTVAAHAPQHVSCYQLTIHEGTPFWKWRERGRLTELDEDSQAELYLTLFETLEAQGLRAYEVSNFARGAAHESTHNRKYWHHVPYLGVGPSAHSFSGNRRWWNHRSTQNWAADVTSARKPIADEEALSDTDLALETVMLRLRTRDGLDLRAYEARFGVDLRAKN